MEYIDCAQYAQEILDEVKAIPNKKELWILTMGNNPASESYVKGKIKDCEYCGIPYSHIKCNTEDSLDCHVFTANTLPNVGGIIVQLPLPKEIDAEGCTSMITKTKDVDGFRDDSEFSPCTPKGIMYVLEKELGNLSGKKALVIGRGKLVGTPISAMLLAADCTVTIAHSKTKNLVEHLRSQRYDIVVVAVGKPKFLNLSDCMADIVIDCGVNRDENGNLCGDCYNFNHCDDGMRVTPVPGGIGLLTRAMLMKNVAEASERKNNAV